MAAVSIFSVVLVFGLLVKFVTYILNTLFGTLGNLCCSKKEELLSWENCYHLSNTDQMEGGLLSIQLLMVGFGLGMLLIRRTKKDPDDSLTDDNFTITDGTFGIDVWIDLFCTISDTFVFLL